MGKDNDYWKKLRPVLNESEEGLHALVKDCQITGECSCQPVDNETMRNAVQIVIITLRKYKKLEGIEYIDELLKERVVVLPRLPKHYPEEEENAL